MTKSQFKYAMCRGLGSCAVALETAEDIEKYRGIILWGCLHRISYDPQCEGTRACYIYKLASYFTRPTYFTEALAAAFRKPRRDGGWLFMQYCELLAHFTLGGDSTARVALDEKYKELYGKLCRCHRDSLARARISDDFDTLCVILSAMDGKERFISIASDLGILFEKHGFTLFDFYRFYCEGERKLRRTDLPGLMLGKASHLRGISDFCREAELTEQTEKKAVPSPTPTAKELYTAAAAGGQNGFSRDMIKFSLKAGAEEKAHLAKLLLSCNVPSVKAALLPVFYCAPFPLSCDGLIADARSEDPELRINAVQALEKCGGSEVRALGLELLKGSAYQASGLCMLITNYQKRDKQLCLLALEELPISYNESDWHRVIQHILWVFENGAGKGLPKELLYYIYDHSLCSCCRERAVRLMGRRRWLSDKIIKECKHDSNEDIRRYYRRVAKRVIACKATNG